MIDYGSRRTKLFTARRALDTGDPDDFAFQLDREMVIAYSFSVSTLRFENEPFDNSQSLLLLSDGQVYHGWGELFDQRRVPVYETHGVWMFFAWMPLGFILLATKRYLKGNWNLWHFVHILAGFLVFVITIW